MRRFNTIPLGCIVSSPCYATIFITEQLKQKENLEILFHGLLDKSFVELTIAAENVIVTLGQLSRELYKLYFKFLFNNLNF